MFVDFALERIIHKVRDPLKCLSLKVQKEQNLIPLILYSRIVLKLVSPSKLARIPFSLILDYRLPEVSTADFTAMRCVGSGFEKRLAGYDP